MQGGNISACDLNSSAGPGCICESRNNQKTKEEKPEHETAPLIYSYTRSRTAPQSGKRRGQVDVGGGDLRRRLSERSRS